VGGGNLHILHQGSRFLISIQVQKQPIHNSRVARQVNNEEKWCGYKQDQRGLTIVQGIGGVKLLLKFLKNLNQSQRRC